MCYKDKIDLREMFKKYKYLHFLSNETTFKYYEKLLKTVNIHTFCLM